MIFSLYEIADVKVEMVEGDFPLRYWFAMKPSNTDEGGGREIFEDELCCQYERNSFHALSYDLRDESDSDAFTILERYFWSRRGIVKDGRGFARSCLFSMSATVGEYYSHYGQVSPSK